MKVLIRPLIDVPLSFSMAKGVVKIGERVIHIPSEPGIYYALEYKSGGVVPHPNVTRTACIGVWDYHTSKDTNMSLKSEGYAFIIAAFKVTDVGIDTILVNTTITPDLQHDNVILGHEEAGLTNLELLRRYCEVQHDPKTLTNTKKLYTEVPTTETILALERQVDVLTSIVQQLLLRSNVPKDMHALLEPFLGVSSSITANDVKRSAKVKRRIRKANKKYGINH